MVDEGVRVFGRLDYCVNSAGIIRQGDTAVLSVDDWESVYQINLRGMFFCGKAEINAMLKQEPLNCKDSPFSARGSIVYVASQAGLIGNGDLPAYVVSKHGVVGLAKCDGLKYAAHGIRVNAVCPGTVDTPMLDTLPQEEVGVTRAQMRSREIAMRRVGKAEEIANCIAFLTSGRASFVTATTLSAHGGLRF
ncbi:hypothetical protein CLAIMM_00127 [Cladophialophora immunda]|nr:hypothetical protein CLAIMM_00127 [Cladophialophora immunda]